MQKENHCSIHVKYVERRWAEIPFAVRGVRSVHRRCSGANGSFLSNKNTSVNVSDSAHTPPCIWDVDHEQGRHDPPAGILYAVPRQNTRSALVRQSAKCLNNPPHLPFSYWRHNSAPQALSLQPYRPHGHIDTCSHVPQVALEHLNGSPGAGGMQLTLGSPSHNMDRPAAEGHITGKRVLTLWTRAQDRLLWAWNATALKSCAG